MVVRSDPNRNTKGLGDLLHNKTKQPRKHKFGSRVKKNSSIHSYLLQPRTLRHCGQYYEFALLKNAQ